jgi:outer membrane lipase/esterase
MRQTNIALALLTAAVLAACGGNGSAPGDQAHKTKFSAQVAFGDSLSDVGSYAVGPVLAANGGKFTVNGNNTAVNPTLTGKNWTELIAAQLSLPPPCAAVTGLDGDPILGFSVPVATHTGCYGYAMGGSRVTNPVGPNNKLLGTAFATMFGAITYPVTTQVANHLATGGGKFKGDELVLVMAGGNDVLSLLGQLQIDATAAGTAAGLAAGAAAFGTSLTTQLAAGATNPATAAQAIGLALQTEAARAGHTDASVVSAAVGAAVQQGNTAAASPTVYGPMVLKAQGDGGIAGAAAGVKAGADYAAANGPKQVAAMATTGTELAALVKTQIVAKGANYVVVNNLPDVSATPSGLAQPASTQALIKAMVSAFNDSLNAGLAGEAKILYVDLFATGRDQIANPAPYGITNLTTPVCTANVLGPTSLACTSKTLIAGDVSHYLYADDVHPTPFGYSLIARLVAEKMVVKGWL